MDRRAFLLGSVSAAVSGAATNLLVAADAEAGKYAPPVLRPPVVGSQLYGWGQYYDREGKRLGEHLGEVFAALRDAGYDYAEGNLDVATPQNHESLAELMRRNGLKPVSLYTGGSFHIHGKASETVESIVKAARVAGQAGFGILNVNTDPVGRPKTDSELAIQADALAELGRELQAIGIRLGIHHHTPEMLNGAREFHNNFEKCPAQAVGFCYDVHWVFRGGIPPATVLPKYGNRIVSWHLRQSRESIWWEDLDSGDIDYKRIAESVAQNKLPQFFTVELALEQGTKITRSVVENHLRSRQYVRRTFGV
jgi:inosose dehydratase